MHTDSQGADVYSYRLVLQYDDSADVLTRIANTDRELAGLPDILRYRRTIYATRTLTYGSF